MAGSMKIGAEFDSPDSGVDTNNVKDQSNFNISLSETTDAGTTISTSFEIVDEGATSADDDNAIKLTFTDGSALELLNAGNASGTHDISVPGSAGEEGVTGTTTNNAPTGLDFAAGSTVLGVEWHSAADFLADGLKVSASFSTDSGAAKTATARLDSSWGLGATYVTSAGDTALTIGAGVSGSDLTTNLTTQSSADQEGYHVGVSAVTGDLTVAVGFADGDTFKNQLPTGANQSIQGSVVKAGISYVTGDLTLALGTTSGEGKDRAFGGDLGSDDAHDEVDGSVTYAVASGVSAVLGYTSVDVQDEGASSNTGGSAWYIGATMSF
jgi:predicted porin